MKSFTFVVSNETITATQSEGDRTTFVTDKPVQTFGMPAYLKMMEDVKDAFEKAFGVRSRFNIVPNYSGTANLRFEDWVFSTERNEEINIEVTLDDNYSRIIHAGLILSPRVALCITPNKEKDGCWLASHNGFKEFYCENVKSDVVPHMLSKDGSYLEFTFKSFEDMMNYIKGQM